MILKHFNNSRDPFQNNFFPVFFLLIFFALFPAILLIQDNINNIQPDVSPFPFSRVRLNRVCIEVSEPGAEPAVRKKTVSLKRYEREESIVEPDYIRPASPVIIKRFG